MDDLVADLAEVFTSASPDRRLPGATLRVLGGHGHICLIAPDLDLATILADWSASS